MNKIKKIGVFIISFSFMLTLLTVPVHLTQVKGRGPLSWSEIVHDELLVDCFCAIPFSLLVVFEVQERCKEKHKN